MKEKKTLVEWVRRLIGRMAPEWNPSTEPPAMSIVNSLINKAADAEKIPASPRPDWSGDDAPANRKEPNPANRNDGNPDGDVGDKGGDDEKPDERGKGCSYALKRNIVSSLQEIRRFAEENNLAGTVVRALLTLLAEMAIGALRGKVSANVLDMLLKVFSYEAALADAYSRGEKDARNAAIEREYFPSGDDGLPHLKGMPDRSEQIPDIFTVAKG
ncbi:MAG: hypothetical protein K2K64_00910 [Muribaculaceae bacterium]|nr:hypothetical protein [Muribaculaceae bacterium]